MNHLEQTLEQECRLYARRMGWIACKLEKNGHKGIPDDMFISPSGQVFLIEFKKDEQQKARPEQQHWMERFPNLIHLVGSIEQFKSALSI